MPWDFSVRRFSCCAMCLLYDFRDRAICVAVKRPCLMRTRVWGPFFVGNSPMIRMGASLSVE
eukprot:11192749-Lingulodinium_polyedra.AAC.1